VDAYEPYAEELARDRGLEERTSFVVADVLEQSDAVDRATSWCSTASSAARPKASTLWPRQPDSLAERWS
jgi:hypothetical protein